MRLHAAVAGLLVAAAVAAALGVGEHENPTAAAADPGVKAAAAADAGELAAHDYVVKLLEEDPDGKLAHKEAETLRKALEDVPKVQREKGEQYVDDNAFGCYDPGAKSCTSVCRGEHRCFHDKKGGVGTCQAPGLRSEASDDDESPCSEVVQKDVEEIVRLMDEVQKGRKDDEAELAAILRVEFGFKKGAKSVALPLAPLAPVAEGLRRSASTGSLGPETAFLGVSSAATATALPPWCATLQGSVAFQALTTNPDRLAAVREAWFQWRRASGKNAADAGLARARADDTLRALFSVPVAARHMTSVTRPVDSVYSASVRADFTADGLGRVVKADADVWNLVGPRSFDGDGFVGGMKDLTKCWMELATSANDKARFVLGGTVMHAFVSHRMHCGHVLASKFGGPSYSALNFFPQPGVPNSLAGGGWYDSEQLLVDVVRRAKTWGSGACAATNDPTGGANGRVQVELAYGNDDDTIPAASRHSWFPTPPCLAYLQGVVDRGGLFTPASVEGLLQSTTDIKLSEAVAPVRTAPMMTRRKWRKQLQEKAIERARRRMAIVGKLRPSRRRRLLLEQELTLRVRSFHGTYKMENMVLRRFLKF